MVGNVVDPCCEVQGYVGCEQSSDAGCWRRGGVIRGLLPLVSCQQGVQQSIQEEVLGQCHYCACERYLLQASLAGASDAIVAEQKAVHQVDMGG